MLLNSAYATLSNAKAKEAYDAGLRQYRSEHAQYDGQPVSEGLGPPGLGPLTSTLLLAGDANYRRTDSSKIGQLMMAFTFYSEVSQAVCCLVAY